MVGKNINMAGKAGKSLQPVGILNDLYTAVLKFLRQPIRSLDFKDFQDNRWRCPKYRRK
jgi:hypothetical protein